MNGEDFQNQFFRARMYIEAMMGNENLRIDLSRHHHCGNSSPDLSPIRKRDFSPEGRKGEIDVLPFERFQGKKKNYKEIAEKNAQELINEEEKAKIKADKKRAKKERQRQKKLNKIIDLSDSNATKNNESGNICSSKKEEKLSDNGEAEDFDVSAAFVSKAIKKVKLSKNLEEFKVKKEEKNFNLLINKAVEYEHEDNLEEAIHYLSEAINLAPDRVDLLLKRSLLYFDLSNFEKSAKDAQKVLTYSPTCSEAYYRLGEAQLALNNLSEADATFNKLLTLDCNKEEVINSLVKIRTKLLADMGYSYNQAFTALLRSKTKTIEEAIEFLDNSENCTENKEDVYYSDEDEESSDEESEDYDKDSEGASGPLTVRPNINIVIHKYCPLLTDPSNIFQCSSLFVGNLKEGITEEEIRNVFIKYGDLKSIKLTTEPNCFAFVNYTESEPAGLAMAALQGNRWLLSTVPLLIKFPHNVVNNSLPYLKNIEFIQGKLDALKKAKSINRPNIKPKKTYHRNSWIKPMAAVRAERRGRPTPVNNSESLNIKRLVISEAPSKYPVIKPLEEGKPRPAPGTEECYFWRTTGCDYGEKCFNLHIPEYKGIALNSKQPFC